MGDLKDRLLAEIERRLAVGVLRERLGRDTDAQPLRALRREVERHSPSTELLKPLCLNCMDVWPCLTITDTARELGVE